MAKKVRRPGNLGPSSGKKSGAADNEVMAGEIDHVAAKTGLSAADACRCLFHSDNYRAWERSATGAAAKEEAAVDEILSGKRPLQDPLDEMAARSEENVALADGLLVAAEGRAVHRPEKTAVDEPEEFPSGWETEYVARKTGLRENRVRLCLIESALYRINQRLAEIETELGLDADRFMNGPEGDA